MTSLHTLKNTRPTTNVQRVGRGDGSKRGKTCCRGQKGAKSRSGYKRRIGYEGGQFPLFRKIPYRGFNNKTFETNVESITLSILLSHFSEGDTVNRDSLIERGFLKNNTTALIKIIGNAKVEATLTIDVDMLSSGARNALLSANCTITE